MCGQRRAAPDRDQLVLGPIVLITDRGLEHVGNEDAAAAGVVGTDQGADSGPPMAVAVCDGVSTSDNAHAAATAAAHAGVREMLAALAAEKSARASVLFGLAAAAAAAAAAAEGRGWANAPSCTYTGAAVVPNPDGTLQIAIGNVGDSRAYWLPKPPKPPVRLTVDDSVAQELITAGEAVDSEDVLRGAHTLTRWLGADAGATPWAQSSVQAMTMSGPGTLLLCSDGLWNYLPDAADIARVYTGGDPAARACALIEYALAAGGGDNITVAAITIGEEHEYH
jgi:serine/threonine protein phosphatase PrpC